MTDDQAMSTTFDFHHVSALLPKEALRLSIFIDKGYEMT